MDDGIDGRTLRDKKTLAPEFLEKIKPVAPDVQEKMVKIPFTFKVPRDLWELLKSMENGSLFVRTAIAEKLERDRKREE